MTQHNDECCMSQGMHLSAGSSWAVLEAPDSQLHARRPAAPGVELRIIVLHCSAS
jgi:hypothetical protein